MRYLIIFLAAILFSCSHEPEMNPLERALASESILIRQVIDSVDQYEVQIKLTLIDREDDTVKFREFDFRLDDSIYFYPASTVKLPVSILVLEQLQKDDRLSLDTPFFVEGDSVFTTLRADIRDIFAVSSNETFNRLFDYLGKDSINLKLREKGLSPVRISHRLSTNDAYNLATKPLIIQQGDSSLVTTGSVINSPIEKLKITNLFKGVGYYNQDELIMEPMDFTERNFLPLSTLHQTLKRLIFPEHFRESERFNLTEEHRDFLMSSMAMYPRELGYDIGTYYDSYGKFFIFGDKKENIPGQYKIYNKVGYAYGFLTDSAYIIDTENNTEFLISATLHVNRNGIFNDDQYEYEEIGIPFLAQLGREIYQQLKKY